MEYNLGPLFQLIIIGVMYSLIAIIFGSALVVSARLVIQLKKRTDISISKFFWFPFSLTPYFLLAIIANALFCKFVRNVDPPFTDYWSLPLSDNLTLGAIDTPDNWSLWPSREGGEAIISNVALVGISDRAFYGRTKSDDYFIYHLQSNQMSNNLSKGEFEMELGNALPKLISPSDFYYDNRDSGDLITILLLLLYPLYRFYKVCSTFWFVANEKNNESIGTATYKRMNRDSP